MAPANFEESGSLSDSSQQTESDVDWRKKESQKWWKASVTSKIMGTHSHRGEACPKCYLADLGYDTLFRLSCPNCGYIAECGAFT